MSGPDFSARQGIHAWLTKAHVAAVALMVLAYGSVTQASLNLAVIAFALLTALSLLYPIGAVAIGRVHAATVLLLATLLIYVVLQVLPLAGGGVANEAWKSVNDLIGPVPGTVSVTPGITLDALTMLALPFLVFLSGLALFQGNDQGLLLWRSLAYFGLGYALFGITQYLLLPEHVLFEQKKYSIGSLTASFVNQNTTGTFLGLAFLLNLGLVFYYLRNICINRFVKKMMDLDIRWGDKNALFLLHALSCLIVALALFLTQSRGAVGASFAGGAVAVVLMATRPLTADKPTGETGKWRRAVGLFGGVIVLVGLFALFAGRAVYRMKMEGGEGGRFCTFASTIDAIKDHPILGTGFGAFQDVFPAYRNAQCAGIYGVWDRAHNFFLEGYLGLGLPFAVALVLGYAILIRVFLYGLRSRHKFLFSPVVALAALVLVSLHSLVDFSLQIPGVAAYFAAIMASSVTISLGRSGE
jgi:O-antigen ligase